jgi:hypothetical protein
MHRPETKTEREVKILCNKPYPWKTVCRIKCRNLWNHFVPYASAISGVKIIAVVKMTWVVQWLRLTFSKASNRVGVSPLTWKRKQIQFPKRCVFYFLEYRTMDEVRKPSYSEYYTPSSEHFRIYLLYIYTISVVLSVFITLFSTVEKRVNIRTFP